MVGKDDSVPAAGVLADKLETGTQSIIYDWPTVVVRDRDHKPKVSPLFAVQIEPEQGPDNRWELHATTEPELNLAVTASGIFDPSITAEVGGLLEHGLPFGDAEAFCNLVAEVADLLGLRTSSPLDARILKPGAGREPGIYNAAISVLAERSIYTAALRKELQQLQSRDDWSATAAAHLHPGGFAQLEVKPTPSGPLAAPLACNHSQEKILERFRRDPLTVVTGPPGTGKTQLVVNAVANAWLDDDKVLVTSTNNGAVDVAVDRARADVRSGLLVRTGNQQARQNVPDLITEASDQAAAEHGNQAAARARLKRAATRRSQLMNKLGRLDDLDRTLLRLAEEREELTRALSNTVQALWNAAEAPKLSMNSHVIQRRAARLLRTRLLPRRRATLLRRRLGCVANAPLEVVLTWARDDQRRAELTYQLEAESEVHRRLKSEVGDPSASVREADREWAEASLGAIHAEMAVRISSGAGRLSDFSRMPANLDRFRRAVRNSLPFLPGWGCTALAAHSNFPLKPGLFDLVIVDEASQCSLAAVLPLAYRARRLGLVGDPCQLNPIVSLSDSRLTEISAQSGLANNDLRERGIHHKDGSAYYAFEFAARPQEPALLNEHYRCHPHIARWFNKTFYGDELTVLTDVHETSQRDRFIGWHDVDGAAEQPSNGSWQNRAEAVQTAGMLRRMIDSGFKTVGVITPFAAQARLIQDLATREFGRDLLDDIDFVSGTAHRLQGGERDAIILSSVLAPGMSERAAAWIERERNLLNVAVSRARRALIALGHPRIGELGSPTLAALRVYLREQIDAVTDAGALVAQFRTDSTSERLLLDAMQLSDLEPYAKLPVEGYELDFALLEQGIKLNVEVDGDQHLDVRSQQRRQDITRDRVLDKLGWTVLRLPAWRCHVEVDSVIEEIEAVLKPGEVDR